MFKEWPLAAFTILGQTAVGLFWFFHVPFLVRGRTPGPGWRVGWLAVLAVVVLLMALAAAASFFHLRHPLRARRALGNLRSSWLSREVLFELAFLALAAANAGLGAFLDPGRGLQWALLAAAGLAGALFIYSMVELYRLPSAPAWMGLLTPLTFLSTTLVMGAVTTELVVRVAAGPGAFAVDLMPVALALIAGDIVVAAAAVPGRGFRPAPSLRPDAAPSRALHRARIACLAAGLVCAAVDVATGANDIMRERGAGPALLLAFLFVLAGETAGRFHFYGFAPRTGLTCDGP